MGKWLEILDDKDLMDYYVENYGDSFTTDDEEPKKIIKNGICEAIQFPYETRTYLDTKFEFYDDFFEVSYNKNNQKVIDWKNNEYYNDKNTLKWTEFDEDENIIVWTDFMVKKIKEKGLDYKQYIKEFKQAYIKEFDLENNNNNRAKLVKKLFKSMDERYLSKEITDELSM